MKCDYGCEREAKFQFKNKKWCCSKYAAECRAVRERNKKSLIDAELRGKFKRSGNNHPICWNRGLTKETSLNVFLLSRKTSKALKGKFTGNKNNARKSWVREKIRNTINKKIENGTWHKSFSKKRTYEYKGFTFDGTWELKYAMWLDVNNRKWIRNTKKFKYYFKNGWHVYTPDFYLIDENCYIEIKGWEMEKDKIAWSQFPENLVILKRNELKELKIIK